MFRVASLLAVGLAAAACGESAAPCDGTAPLPSRQELHCEAEFAVQAARPLDSSLPGARTVKTIIDQAQDDTVHFLDTNTYPLHQPFAVQHLGYPPDGPFVNEYFLPQRRFLLGSITHYEEPDIWAYELAPYDTSSVEMIAHGYHRLADAAYFGDRLKFHPTSEEQKALAAMLPEDVPVVTTDEIYAGITYQPLNLGEAYAQVRILTVDQLLTEYVSPRELAVLDRVPNDISVVAGVVTEEFQTPLSHVNVLSQQRGTPNMGLKGAANVFTPYDGQWVRLTVRAFDYEVASVTQAEADAWWQDHRPTPVVPPAPNYAVTGLLDVDDIGVADVSAAGGKAANFGELRDISGITVRDGFVIPVHYFREFLQQNGFDVEIAAMIADPEFQGDGNVRRARLLDLQLRMRVAPVDPAFAALLQARLDAEFPGTRMKFRSSTTAEDLAGWTGAGLYDSFAGDPNDPAKPVLDAVRGVWASIYNFRAWEERAYVSIDQEGVAMAVLVIPSYTDEAANGVAISANVFDPAPGGEDAFYVNAQLGEVSVVQPDPGITCDQLLYFYFHNGQPATYYTHSSLIPAGATVLTRAQLFELGQALDKIRLHFEPLYDNPAGYARLPMDVEWKLQDGHIEIKQARPYPGRGQ